MHVASRDSRQETCLNAPILGDEDRACEVDDDCEFAGQGIGLCVSQDSEINRSPEFGPFAECIARTSQCGCLNNRCGLRVDVESRTMRNGRGVRLDRGRLGHALRSLRCNVQDDKDPTMMPFAPRDCATEKSPHDPDGGVGDVFLAF